MSEITKRIIAGLFLCFASGAVAQVSVSQGNNPIPDAEALDDKDIVVQNAHLAFALAVESPAPWGIPRGALVDLSVVEEGQPRGDRIAFADFIPNAWSAWPNESKKVEILKDSGHQATIKITRNFGEVDIATWYTLKSGADSILLKTVMTNNGAKPVSLTSGFTLWPDAGHMFAAPGLNEDQQRNEKTQSDRTVAYDRDWAFALHAPYFTMNVYEGRDMYQSHDLAPGQSRTFEAQLQVVPDGDLMTVVKAEAARKNLPTGIISGKIQTSQGNVPDDAMVIIQQNDELYAWTMAKEGQYEVALPRGEYQVYGTASGHADSKQHTLTVSADSKQTVDFTDLAGPGTLKLSLTDAASGTPLDGRISILQGQRSAVEFLGKRTFFTKLLPVGKADIKLPPGNYKLGIGSGAGFTSEQQVINVGLQSGKTMQQQVKIAQLSQPNERQWYSADLHHHGNILEAITPPETVVRAQLAAGLDVIFISEHDSTINYAAFAELSDKRGVPFLPSIEISPSWGHMNPFPIDLDATLNADPGTDDIHTLMAAIREMGASVVAMNHPFNDYGYYANLKKGVVPGGESDGFTLLELNAAMDNTKTVNKAHSLWDEGKKMYFNAGTDTHDAWNQKSGNIRMMARVPDPLSAQRFAEALKHGHAYATTGPLLYPRNIMFGDSADAASSWEVDIEAVNGISEIRLLGKEGQILKTKKLKGEEITQKVQLKWIIPTSAKGWVSLEVDDKKGNTAWSNPVWIK
ncbi:CehA/McbA family metallohydrolase [Salinimonas chungwhensis]|uniref:CehA/McbA family metallohydrolase n=1 Tax=Salinimonas chungwhensis TaxID=265425 RepID=UPI0003781F31|nr:CehA/McbA family metallohydrolase [Salinimonas chungwhensis]